MPGDHETQPPSGVLRDLDPGNRVVGLSLDNDQTIAGSGKRSNTNRIASKHLGRNIRRIVARTENDDVCATESAQETFEIVVGRDQDKSACADVLQNPEIAVTCQAIFKRTFGFREEIAQEVNQLRRKALVEEELHLSETLRPAASSAA
jgi:hypothetical protein